MKVVHEGTWDYQGGAERLASQIASGLNSGKIIGYSEDMSGWEDSEVLFPEFGGLLSYLPVGMKELLMGIGFTQVEFEDDMIISSGTTAKWWTPKTDQKHIHYCHSPPEKVWVDDPEGIIDKLAKEVVKRIDKHYAQKCDKIIVNSEFTKNRVDKYYDRDSTIVNPPIDIDGFEYQKPSRDHYFVMIGRLNEMKRSEMVARTFDKLDQKLVIVGDGPKREVCEGQDGVRVFDHLSDTALQLLVGRSIGGVAFAEQEHYGMTSKEFQAAGKPVLVPDEQNLCNHVQDGQDGVVVEPTQTGVINGVNRILNTDWDKDEIESSASDVGIEQFNQQIKEIVE